MNGIIKIHGKDYKTVAARVSEFRVMHPDWTIMTDLLLIDETRVVVQATIKDTAGRVISQGLAEEQWSSSKINSTSAVENGETSAVGRCIRFYMGEDGIASADEVQNAIAQQTKTVESVLATVTDKDRVWELFKRLNIHTPQECKVEIQTITGKASKDLDAGDYEDLIIRLTERLADLDPINQFDKHTKG